MKKMTKKLFSMMLALAMVLTLIPTMGVVAQAAEDESIVTVTYIVGDSTEVQTAEVSEIGGHSFINGITDALIEGKAYLAELPYGSIVQDIIWTEMAEDNEVDFSKTVGKQGIYWGDSLSEMSEEQYLVDSDFKPNDSDDGLYKSNVYDRLSDTAKNCLKTSDVKGFAATFWEADEEYNCLYSAALVIQISTKADSPSEETDPAVTNVTDLIDVIDVAAVTLEDKDSITEARKAYNALTDAQKEAVKNYSNLVIAEKTIEVLEAKAELEQAKSELETANAAKETAVADAKKANEEKDAAVKAAETAQSASDKDAKELETVKAELAKVKAQSATVEGLKVKTKAKKITVSWTKSADAEGYQVAYKVKKAKSFKTVDTTATKTVVKKLKKGKKYQVKVRSYKTVNGEKVYGTWTAVKTIKCK